jgi:hypothetical protein
MSCCFRKKARIESIPNIRIPKDDPPPPTKTQILERLVDAYVRVASKFNKRNIHKRDMDYKFGYLMFLEGKIKSFKPSTNYQHDLYNEYQTHSRMIDKYVFPNGIGRPRESSDEKQHHRSHFVKTRPTASVLPPTIHETKTIEKEDDMGLSIETILC